MKIAPAAQPVRSLRINRRAIDRNPVQGDTARRQPGPKRDRRPLVAGQLRRVDAIMITAHVASFPKGPTIETMMSGAFRSAGSASPRQRLDRHDAAPAIVPLHVVPLLSLREIVDPAGHAATASWPPTIAGSVPLVDMLRTSRIWACRMRQMQIRPHKLVVPWLLICPSVLAARLPCRRFHPLFRRQRNWLTFHSSKDYTRRPNLLGHERHHPANSTTCQPPIGQTSTSA